MNTAIQCFIKKEVLTTVNKRQLATETCQGFRKFLDKNMNKEIQVEKSRVFASCYLESLGNQRSRIVLHAGRRVFPSIENVSREWSIPLVSKSKILSESWTTIPDLLHDTGNTTGLTLSDHHDSKTAWNFHPGSKQFRVIAIKKMM